MYTKHDGDKAAALCRRVTLDQDEMALHQVAEVDKSQTLPNSIGKNELKGKTARHQLILEWRLARVALWNIGCDESSVTSIDVGIIDAQTSPPETVGSHVVTLASFAVLEHNQPSTKTATGQGKLLERRLARLEVWGDSNDPSGTDKGFAKRG